MNLQNETPIQNQQTNINKADVTQNNVSIENKTVDKKPKKGFCGCFGCICIFLLLGIFILLALLMVSQWQSSRYIKTSLENYPQVNDPAEKGTITGSLSYPGEGIPEMGICVQETATKNIFCTYKIIEDNKFTYGKGYELSLEAGSYQVFSHLVTDKNRKLGYTNEEKIYYSEFVTCGLEYKCTSHKPIIVQIKAGDKLTNIDPIDWYNQ